MVFTLKCKKTGHVHISKLHLKRYGCEREQFKARKWNQFMLHFGLRFWAVDTLLLALGGGDGWGWVGIGGVVWCGDLWVGWGIRRRENFGWLK